MVEIVVPKGALPVPNSMNFQKTSDGGEVISDPKNFVAFFSEIFWGERGGGHANPNEFRCKFLGLPKKAQHSFPKRGRGRGGSEAVWKFSENSLNLVQIVIPK